MRKKGHLHWQSILNLVRTVLPCPAALM